MPREPRVHPFLVALGVAGATLVAARLVGPSLVAGPPGTSGAWLAWLAVGAPWAAALGSAAAVRGAEPSWRERRVAVSAGWLVGGVAVLALLSPFVDAAPLFPVATSVDTWEPLGAALVDRLHGVRVEPDGSLHFVEGALPVGGALPLRHGALAAVVATASGALWAPLLVVIPGGTQVKAASLALSLALTVLLFHAVAAGRAAPLALAAGSLPLALAAFFLALRRPPAERPAPRAP